MKKIILIMILFPVCLINGFSQIDGVTNNPEYRSRDNKKVKINKIEITNEFTIVTMTFRAGHWVGNTVNWDGIYFRKGYIDAGGLKYELMKSDIDNFRKADTGDDLEFNLYFQPIKKGIEMIDIIETDKSSKNYRWINFKINFYGVKINNPENNLPVANNNDLIKTDDNTDFVSDVDQNIPVNNISNDETFALVIGNETYGKEIKVQYAVKDATIFRQYLQKTLGLTDNNIQYLENGTFGQILDALKWISDVAKAYNGQAKIIFYYAGHGMPDEQTKSAYLLPVDGNSQNPGTAIKLSDIYNKLTEYPSVSVTVFLDACFSGATRETNGTMLAESRGVKIKPKSESLSGNLVVFSAATGDETAFPYTEKQHGMFTYFLLKKLQESNGKTTLNELGDYIITNVTRKSVVINKKIQTPEVNTSSQVQNTWQTLKLR